MSDIKAIIQSVINVNDQGKDFLREIKKMPKPDQEKLLGTVEKLRGEVAELSKTAMSIKKAVSPENPFVAARAKAKAAQESAELEQELGGYESIVVPASSLGSVKEHEFCATGQVEGMEREELQDLIKSHGGTVQKRLTKGVDVLVIGNAPGPKKVTKAQEREIDIVLALDLIKWIEKG